MDEKAEREMLCKKFAFELVTLMEAKIIQMSAEQEKEVKKLNLNKTPNKSTTTKVFKQINKVDQIRSF